MDSTEALDAGAQGRGRPMNTQLDEAILDATCSVLIRSGYRGFSLDAVAREARTTRPAIARRWESREDILLAALDHVMRVATVADFDPRALNGLSDADLVDALMQMVRGFTAIVSDARTCAVSVALSTAVMVDEQLREAVQRHHYDRRRPLEQTMRAAQARGLLRQDIPIDHQIHTLVGAIQYRTTMLGEVADEAYLASVTRALLVTHYRARPYSGAGAASTTA